MGKGSKRREFDKDREAAFVKNHELLYGPMKKSPFSRRVYVMRGGSVVQKEAR